MKPVNKININLILNDVSLKRFKNTPTFTNLLYPNQLDNLTVGDNKLTVNHTVFGSLQRLASTGNYIVNKLENINETEFKVGDDNLTDFMSKTKGKLGPTDVVSVDDKNKSKVSTTTSSPSTSTTTMGISETENSPAKLKYLSNVKDSKTGQVSKPFTKNGKNYQMVRCLNNENQVVSGIYSLDEIDEAGENKIYELDFFENNMIKDETEINDAPASVESDKNTPSNTPSAKPSLNPLNLSEFKHFFVNKNSGAVRKFKTDEELARATLGEEESYMKIHDFKKFVEETVFGSRKKQIQEDDLAAQGNELHAQAAKLMKLISTKISPRVIDQIKNNRLAQKEVILSFAELIGVPRTMLSKVIAGIKDQAAVDGTQSQEGNQAPSTGQQPNNPVSESKVITKKALIDSVIPKKSTIVKVKNFK